MMFLELNMRIMKFKRNIHQKRTISMITLVVLLPVIGIIYSPILMGMGLKNGFITSSAIIFSIWLVLSLFIGRAASCGYTCPYGAIQEITGGWILNRRVRNPRLAQLKYLVFIIFMTSVAFSIFKLGGLKGVNFFALNSVISTPGPSLILPFIAIPIFIVIISLMSMIFGSRAFCRYLCPQSVLLIVGTEIGKLLQINCLSLDSHPEKCTNCDICNQACPMGLEISQMVRNDSLENVDCIMCGECVHACPKEVIKYSPVKKIIKKKNSGLQ